MEFQMVVALVVLWLMNIVCILFLFTTFSVGNKLIGQFKCPHCKKYNKLLTSKCKKCNKSMQKDSYRYKSTFFGKVSIKDGAGRKVLAKAIKWIAIDFTIILLLVIGLSTLLYLIHTR